MVALNCVGFYKKSNIGKVLQEEFIYDGMMVITMQLGGQEKMTKEKNDNKKTAFFFRISSSEKMEDQKKA